MKRLYIDTSMKCICACDSKYACVRVKYSQQNMWICTLKQIRKNYNTLIP